MKGIKKLLIILLIITMLPLTVYAEPEIIKTDSFEFELTETPITCLSEGTSWFPYMALENGRIIYLDLEDIFSVEPDFIVYIPETNTCESMTKQDTLALNNPEKTGYLVSANSNGNLTVYKETRYETDNKFVLTEDTTVNANKEYFKKEIDETTGQLSAFVNAGTVTDEQLPTLYESIELTYPVKAEILDGKTYYKYVEPNEEKLEVVKVSAPTLDEIDKYLVSIGPETEYKKEEVKKYTNNKFAKIAASLGHNNFDAIKLGSLNEYNFIVEEPYKKEDEPDATYYRYDIYNKNGSIIYNDLPYSGSYAPLENKAALVYTGNNKMNLFDGNLKLVKTFGDVEMVLVNYIKGTEYDTAQIISLDKKLYQLKIKQTGEIVEPTPTTPTTPNNPANPNTSDKIIISLIIAVLSIFGLKKIIKKVRQSF